MWDWIKHQENTITQLFLAGDYVNVMQTHATCPACYQKLFHRPLAPSNAAIVLHESVWKFCIPLTPLPEEEAAGAVELNLVENDMPERVRRQTEKVLGL